MNWANNKALWDTFIQYLPTEGDMIWVSTLTSITASMMVLLCRLDKVPTIALAACWIRLWSGRSSGWKD